MIAKARRQLVGFYHALGTLLGEWNKAASSVRIHTRVFIACMAAGIMLSLGVSLVVRARRDEPAGAERRSFSHLLGTTAPQFQLPSLETGVMGWSDKLVGDAAVLYFTDSRCPACDEAYPYLKRVSGQVRLLIVGVGSRDTLRKKWAVPR